MDMYVASQTILAHWYKSNLQISSPLSFLYSIFAAKAPTPSASLYVRTPGLHNLIVKDRDSVELKTLGLDYIQKYNLADLYAIVPGHKYTNEEAAKEYQLQICLEDSALAVSKDLSQHNKLVREWQEMTSFATNTQQRPDACIRDLAGNLNLISEVHSGNSVSAYEQTAFKTLIGLVTHFRYLRMKCDVHSVIGFTFPNMVDRFFVTKVTVSYNDFRFYYAFKVIEMGDVPKELKQAYRHNRKTIDTLWLHNQPDTFNTFSGFPVRLTDAELTEASEKLGLQNPLQQFSSVTSMVLKDPDGMKIYKYNPDVAEHSRNMEIKTVILQKLQDEGMLPSIPMELVLLERVQMLFNLAFYVFPMKEPPLSYEEALQCLGYLVNSTAHAIESLHEYGYAHLDIRLDNICFHVHGGVRRAVLIDFDYAIPAMSECVPLRVTPNGEASCMYSRLESNTDWLAKQYDWMQLGWMAFYVYNYEEFKDEIPYHQMNMVWDSDHGADDTFLRKAILQGKYSPSDLNCSPIYLKHQNPL